jgi:hypothetical protein
MESKYIRESVRAILNDIGFNSVIFQHVDKKIHCYMCSFI